VLAGASGSAVGTHGGALKRPRLPLTLALLVEGELKSLETTVPGAIAAPAAIAVVEGLPRTIAFRDVAPLAGAASAPEDAVETGTMRVPGMAWSFSDRKERVKKPKVCIRAVVSAQWFSFREMSPMCRCIRWRTTISLLSDRA
jgi:hypothetical protein